MPLFVNSDCKVSFLTLIFFDLLEIQLETVGKIETPQVDAEGEAEAIRSAMTQWNFGWIQLVQHFEKNCFVTAFLITCVHHSNS